MNAEELYDEWTEGESTGVRPKRVQVLRDDLMRHTDLTVPRRVQEIQSWLPRYKGHVTKQLKEAAGLARSDEDVADNVDTDPVEGSEDE